MKPRLYEAGTLIFDNNGFGSLADAKECEVKTAFGAMELVMQYPVTGRLFRELTDWRIILAETEPLKDPQPFYIYRITKPMDGVVTVYGRHVCYRLDGYPVRPFTANTAAEAMAALKANAMVAHPFSFETDVERNGSFALTKPTATWSVLGGTEGSILDTFHGEYEFDHYTVRLLTRRGADRGVSLRYGKNLQTLEQDANCAGCCTGIVPYWVNTQTGETVFAEPVRAEGNFGYDRIPAVDFTDKFESKPTVEQLEERAKTYIKDNDIGKPSVSLKVKFVPLDQTEELRHLAQLERVQFGDTVHVYFPQIDVDVAARVVETTYDSLRGRFKEVDIGKVKQTLADLIVQQQKEIDKIPTGTALAIAMATATQAIVGAKGGAVRLLDLDGDDMPDTLYVADNADVGLAKYVWRWNWMGWACSDQGFNGPYKMAATLDGGIVADMITAGNLNASLITTGILNADLIQTGTINADLIKAGKLAVKYLDVDNLVVKALRAVEETEDGFKGIIETDKGRLRVYTDDGSVVREVMNLGAEYLPVNFATNWASLRMYEYREGVRHAALSFAANNVAMLSEFGMRGKFSAAVNDITGLVEVHLDSLNPSASGNCTWVYIESLGKKVLCYQDTITDPVIEESTATETQ